MLGREEVVKLGCRVLSVAAVVHGSLRDLHTRSTSSGARPGRSRRLESNLRDVRGTVTTMSFSVDSSRNQHDQPRTPAEPEATSTATRAACVLRFHRSGTLKVPTVTAKSKTSLVSPEAPLLRGIAQDSRHVGIVEVPLSSGFGTQAARAQQCLQPQCDV